MQSRFLLLDSRLVEATENAKLTVGHVRKDGRNPLFREDKPWEPRFDNVYANVIRDEGDGLYKCWYSPFIVDERTTSTPPEKRNRGSCDYMSVKPNGREMGVCYAVSEDGVAWEKPELGLVEFEGSTRNNIVLRGSDMKGMFRGPHGAGVFRDAHETDPARRYKMFFRAEKMAVAFSADGLRWGEPVLCPEIESPGDTHNNAFRAEALGRYVGITRLKTKDDVKTKDSVKTKNDIRLVARTESEDFVHWTKAGVVLEGLEPHLQLHDMVAFPHAGVYLGLIGLFNTDKRVDRQHVELAWSADTVAWRRVSPGTPLIPNGEEGACDWGCAFASAPVFLNDLDDLDGLDGEIRLYYGANNGRFFDWRDGFLCLATLRPDGFAGYEQVSAERPAFVTTAPVAFPEVPLRISADVRDGGSVRVALLGDDGDVSAESGPVRASVTDGEVAWQDGPSPKALADGSARLRFELRDAKLYSYSFGG